MYLFIAIKFNVFNHFKVNMWGICGETKIPTTLFRDNWDLF